MIRLSFSAKAVSMRGTVAAILTFCSFVFFLAVTASGLDKGLANNQSLAYNSTAVTAQNLFAGITNFYKFFTFDEPETSRPDVLWMRGGHGYHQIHTPHYTPDGQYFVTAGMDRTVKVWRTSDNIVVRTIYPFSSTVFPPALSPNGEFLAVSGVDGTPQNPVGATKIYRVSTGELLNILPSDKFSGSGVDVRLTFSPDGSLLAAPTAVGQQIQLWRVSDGSLIQTFSGGGWTKPDVYAPVAFHPNGQWIVGTSSSGGGDVNVVRISDGERIKRWTNWTMETSGFGVPQGGNRVMTFTPDGRYLLAGRTGGDQNNPQALLALWDMNDPCYINSFNNQLACDGAAVKVLLPFPGNTGGNFVTNNLVFSSDGSTLAMGGYLTPTPGQSNGVPTIKLWQTSDWTEIHSYTANSTTNNDGYYYSFVAFTPDGTGLLSVNKDIRLWSVADGSLLGKLNALEGNNINIAYSPDGEMVAVSNGLPSLHQIGSVNLFDADNGSLLRTIDLNTQQPGALALGSVTFSPDSQMVAVSGGYYGGTGINFVKIFDAATGDLIRTINDVTYYISPKDKQLAFSPDGQTVVVSSHVSSPRLNSYRISDGTQQWSASGGCSQIAFSPNGQSIVCSGSATGGAVTLYNAANGFPIKTLVENGVSFTSEQFMSLSPDGQTIVTGTSVDGANFLRVWRVSDSTLLHKISSSAKITAIQFSSDGQNFIAFSNDGLARIYSTEDGSLLKIFNEEVGSSIPSGLADTTGIYSTAYSPDNSKIFWGRQDAAIVMASNPFYVPPTYTISGQVTENGNALSNVSITLSGSASASTTTDSSGNYSFTNLDSGGNFTLTPSLANHTFDPSSSSINNLSADQTVNFVGTASCSYSVPNGSSVTPSIGTYSVAVTAPNGCGWTAVSNAAWITVTSGVSGTGNGTVTYSVSANNGAARTGSITIAGKTFTVAQGTTTNVSSQDVSGLIAAINAANSTPGHDVINLPQSSTYTLTIAANDDGYRGAFGLPSITSQITINGNGATIERSSNPNTPKFRVVDVFGGGDLTLDAVTIKGGEASDNTTGIRGWGGGILNNNNSKLTLRNSTVTDNRASEGGGIVNYCSTLVVENSTISNNTAFMAGYGGAGILNFASFCQANARVSNSTIYENQADATPGFQGRGDAISNVAGSFALKNSIIASPTRGIGSDCYGNVINSLGRNITSDNTCGFNGNGDQVVGNLQLGALANNGGPTPTHALLVGSPAIDAVPAADCTTVAGLSITKDQRGTSRPQGAACDVGAYEFKASINVANGDVAGLIAAINAANSSPGPDVINLAAGSTYTLNVQSGVDGYRGAFGLPSIKSQITINGNGAIIERSSDPNTPKFRVLDIFEWGDLTLNEVTIKGGSTSDPAGGLQSFGGGILNNHNSRLTLTNSTVTGNIATDGGGIANVCSQLNIVNSTISHNSATGGYGGGGILNFGGCAYTVKIGNSTIYENQNDLGRGNAISDNFSVEPSITIKNSILASPTKAGLDCSGYYPPNQIATPKAASLGYNIVSDNSCGLNGNGDQIVPTLQLGALANNGGPTPTHALLSGSPAIDAVPVADCTTVDGTVISTDQRGVARPKGSACDVGAFEAYDVTPPVLTLPDELVIEATSPAGAVVNYTATATDEVDGDVAVNCSPASGSLFALGTTTVNCSASDQSGNSATGSFTVNIVNAPPTANAGGPYQVNEGGSVLLSGTGSDPEGQPLTYAWDLDNNGTFETAGQSVTFSAAGLDGFAGSNRTVKLQVTDVAGATATSTAIVNILNVVPTVTDLTGPTTPQPVNTAVNISVSHTDPAGALDSYTVTTDWGDGTTDNGTSHVYTAAGVYRIKVVVSDEDGGVSAEKQFEYVVVFDPSAGFVTGGGWIMSPMGAYKADPTLAGKAMFGFVSKYQKGTNQPTGDTQFQFHAGDFRFNSDSYEWLVIAGAKAQYKGTGTVNGVSGYSFILTATDGQVNGGGGVDKFRIKIWNAGGIVYDNVTGVSDKIDEANPQAIGGGNIIIQSNKK